MEVDATRIYAGLTQVAWGMFFFATCEPFNLVDRDTKKKANSVLMAPVKIPMNILRGRSPFHGIGGIGDDKKKKETEKPAAPAAAPAAVVAAAPAAIPKPKKRWFGTKKKEAPAVAESIQAAAAPAAAAVQAATAPAVAVVAAPAPAAPKPKKRWFWQKEPVAPNPDEKIRPAPAWAVYAMLAAWYGVAFVMNGTFRTAVASDLGARAVKEAVKSEARMKMGL